MMTIDNSCLTIKQAKELQSLGIDFGNTILCYYGIAVNERSELIKDIAYELMPRTKVDRIVNEVPTLTVSEMIEMLPKEIDYYQLKIVPFDHGYCVEYELYTKHLVYICKDRVALDFCFSLLRDSLFEMIKSLRKNELI